MKRDAPPPLLRQGRPAPLHFAFTDHCTIFLVVGTLSMSLNVNVNSPGLENHESKSGAHHKKLKSWLILNYN